MVKGLEPEGWDAIAAFDVAANKTKPDLAA